MYPKLNILLVEDSESDADLLIRHLKKEKIDFFHTRVWQKEAFINSIKDNNPDLIIADNALPQFSGMEAFHILKKEKKQIPFILVTGTVSEKLLAEYAKEGIDDYILKENLLRLPSAIEHVVSKKRVEVLHKKLEIAHKDIKDSINYAKIIQDATLPDIAMLSDIFPESFILFQPKDILSGDFYWFEKRESEIFFTIADCTGHGVPGALLAMMGNNLLNEAVNIKKIIQPSAILHRLKKTGSKNI